MYDGSESLVEDQHDPTLIIDGTCWVTGLPDRQTGTWNWETGTYVSTVSRERWYFPWWRRQVRGLDDDECSGDVSIYYKRQSVGRPAEYARGMAYLTFFSSALLLSMCRHGREDLPAPQSTHPEMVPHVKASQGSASFTGPISQSAKKVTYDTALLDS